jgi:hypothetical protein
MAKAARRSIRARAAGRVARDGEQRRDMTFAEFPRAGRCVEFVLAMAVIATTPACQTRPRPASHIAVARPVPTPVALEAALSGADRVEVNWVGADGGMPSPVALSGPGMIKDFLAMVRPVEFAGEYPCTCGVAQRLKFFRGAAVVAELEVHRYRWLGWSGEANTVPLAGEPNAFTTWFTRNGGTVAQLFPPAPPQAAKAFNDGNDEANREFVASFPPSARQLAGFTGPSTVEGFDPRRESSNLRELVPDNAALAAAAFRAFGVHSAPWLVDDYRTGAIQTAVGDLPAVDVMRAIRAAAGDERALRGAARIFFRLALHRKFTPEFNAEVIPVLADAVLRSGRSEDKPVMLILLAATENPAVWNFLREVADGKRVYPWGSACEPYRSIVHEPSLPMTAKVLLALHGESSSRTRPKPATAVEARLDAEAEAVAGVLLDPARAMPASAIYYPSHILGYCAAEALARQSPSRVPAAALTAALAHDDHWVVRRVRPLANQLSLQRLREPVEVNLFAAPVPQNLATDDPPEAIRQCTEILADARGIDRTALLLIRAMAHEARAELEPAVTDFEAALKNGGYTPDIIHGKLAWLKFYQGRFIDATRDIEGALRAKADPDLHFLRGLIGYATNDFGPGTEMDFTIAAGLAPAHGYASIFQHLTCLMGGHPELSRLRLPPRRPPETTAPPTIFITGPSSLQFNPGGEPEVAWWPATVVRFFRGEIAAAELRQQAGSGRAQICEANYYIAQAARAAGQPEEELVALRAAVATGASEVVEYRLAGLRLDANP